MSVKYAGKILQDTDGFDLLKLYEDLFLTEKERLNMAEEGIQSVDLSKIRCNAGDKKTSGVNAEKELDKVYGNKYRIPLDREILKDHGAFYPRALDDELVFELRLAPASNVVLGSDPADLDYEINNRRLSMKLFTIRNLLMKQSKII